jgi:carboxypeptidase Q
MPDYYEAATTCGEKTAKFLASEHALAVILPSRDGQNGGGSGGTIFDDNGSFLTKTSYLRDDIDPVPVAVTAIENYGRVYRSAESQCAGQH